MSNIFISATQLSQFWGGCQRQWGFKYISKLPDKTGPGAALGTCCHWLLEKDGKPDTPPPPQDVWELANTTPEKVEAIMAPFFASDYCPPKEHPHELMFKIPQDGFTLLGKIDWLTVDTPPDGGVDCPVIGDLKTFKDRRHLKSVIELMADWQAMVYETFALTLLGPNQEWTRLRWVYVKTTKDRAAGAYPEPHAIEPWIPRAQMVRNSQKVLDACQPLVQHRRNNTDPFTMEMNPEACSRYGGCPYREICEKGSCDMANTTELEQLIAQARASLGGAPPTAPQTTAFQPPTEPVKEDAAPSPAPPPGELEGTLKALLAAQQQVTVAQPPPAFMEDEHTMPEAPPVAAALPVPEAPPEVKKRRPGRPKGSKNAPKTTTPPAPAAEPAPPAAQPASPAVVKARPGNLKTLYVNCGPVRSTAPWLHETGAYQRAEKEAATAGKAEHWALIEYGKGPGVLATCFQKHMHELPCAVRLSTSTPSAKAVYELLTMWADEIVVQGG